MRIAICDDEQIYIDQIRKYLTDFFNQLDGKIHPEIVEFSNGEELLKDTGVKDIVFLDVEMQGLSGIHTGRKLKEQNEKVIIFIVTSFQEYLDEAMRFRVYRYLSKPIDKRRFFRNMKDAIATYTLSNTKVAIETKEKVITVYEEDIVFVEAQGRKVYVQTIDEKYQVIHNMEYWENHLNKGSFFRTHRSFIVNMKYVNETDSMNVYLCNRKYRAYLTRRKYKEFKEAYSLYLESVR